MDVLGWAKRAMVGGVNPVGGSSTVWAGLERRTSAKKMGKGMKRGGGVSPLSRRDCVIASHLDPTGELYSRPQDCQKKSLVCWWHPAVIPKVRRIRSSSKAI